MRVNSSPSNVSVDQVRSKSDQARSTEKSGASTGVAEGDTFERSPVLSRLVDTLRDLPEVREDVLAAVRAKIEAGELATEASLAATASGIVDGQG